MLRRLLVVLAVVLTGVSIGAAPARAVSGGSAMPAASSASVARLNVGGVRACSGALVAPQWVITVASCLAVDGKISSSVPLPTTATIGGADIPVVRLHPHSTRDVVLARLSLRVADVAPFAVSGGAPAEGEAVQAAGYGRTATEWVPDRPYAAPVTVGAVAADSFGWTGQEASACQGDAGGPVYRTGGARPDLLGLHTASGQGGCLDASTTGNGATAVRVDDLASWITGVASDISTAFRTYHSSSTGIGSYDLSQAGDQVVPFDYDHSGKLDHLVAYRPGTGIVHIVKHNPDDTYTTIFSSTTGIGGYDLKSAADRIVPYDYDHSGKLDHLVLYRPGSRTAFVLKHGAGNTFTQVYSNTTAGIGTWDLSDPRDQLLAFDYEHTGKLDHLLIYRPGTGWIAIVKHGAGNSFSKVFASTTGIGGYDLKSAADRIVAFDYDHSRKLDHLVLYRPGSRIAWVLKHGADNTFTAVYHTNTAGIGGYNLADSRDQLLAYDYDYSGKLDHLVLYRPGVGIVHILEHGAGNSFAPVVSSVTGIGGYDLKGASDRIVAFDRDHSGGPNHLLLYRPGHRIAFVVGRETPPVHMVVIPRPIVVEDSIMEGFRYPGAAAILESLNVRLISGDGHILLADCDTPPVNNVGVIRVWTTEQIGPDAAGQICFKVTGPVGRLDLEVPGVYSIRGDGQAAGYGHQLTAVVDTASGSPTTVVVNPSGYTPVGIGVDPDNEPTTLLQLRVPA